MRTFKSYARWQHFIIAGLRACQSCRERTKITTLEVILFEHSRQGEWRISTRGKMLASASAATTRNIKAAAHTQTAAVRNFAVDGSRRTS